MKCIWTIDGFYYTVNSTFPLDFVITLNGKREILLFHKYMQKAASVRGLSSREVTLVYLDKFNWRVKALYFSWLPKLHSLLFVTVVDLLISHVMKEEVKGKRCAEIPQWNYSQADNNNPFQFCLTSLPVIWVMGLGAPSPRLEMPVGHECGY